MCMYVCVRERESGCIHTACVFDVGHGRLSVQWQPGSSAHLQCESITELLGA